MKKAYTEPVAERIEFAYDQTVVASGPCEENEFWTRRDKRPCSDVFIGYGD